MFYCILFVVGVVLLLWYFTRCTPYSLLNRNVLITGAGSGIGRKMAVILASKGIQSITLWDLNEEGLQGTQSEIAALKTKVKTRIAVVDVSNAESVDAAAKEVLQDIGHIDVLINNAGIVSGKSIVKGDLSSIAAERTLRVNSLAHFHLWRNFLPRMVQRKEGFLVTISSVMGMAYSANLTDYCASKWAALGAHHSLRLELKANNLPNVQSLVVCPFAIATGMFDGVFEGSGDTLLRRLFFPILSPDWVAQRVVTGIENGERLLVMPKILRLLGPVMTLLPIGLMDVLFTLLGGCDGMKNFRGREGAASASKKKN
eukprot:PhF_6_TR25396/c0_g1_i1/m.35114/K15734/SDR16C5; all-trans-retinol dehydrogenase (NAD+)